MMETGDAAPGKVASLEEALHDVTPATTRVAFLYFAAAELKALGQDDAAKRLWRRALLTPAGDVIYRTLSGFELAKESGQSLPEGFRMTQDDVWGKAIGE